MFSGSVGIITYKHHHLKTEQVLLGLVGKVASLKVFALPFVLRKPRTVVFQHRPEQSGGAHTEQVARMMEAPYVECDSDVDVDDSCDLYLILGAGILSAECLRGKQILNCHPGLIPLSRGLDSFKWAIHENKPVGNTLHYIDAEVDAGEVVSSMPTPVFRSDTPETLARRHYELEIDMLVDFQRHLQEGRHLYRDCEPGEAHRRMPRAVEEQMLARFPDYVAEMAEVSGT